MASAVGAPGPGSRSVLRQNIPDRTSLICQARSWARKCPNKTPSTMGSEELPLPRVAVRCKRSRVDAYETKDPKRNVPRVLICDSVEPHIISGGGHGTLENPPHRHRVEAELRSHRGMNLEVRRPHRENDEGYAEKSENHDHPNGD